MGVVIRPVRLPGQKPARAKERKHDDDDDIIGWRAPEDSCWRVETLAVELGVFRLSLELSLAGAILKCPRIGMLRADECGRGASISAASSSG